MVPFVVASVAVVLLVMAVAIRRSGLLYRSPRYLRWRRAKSRRDRGKLRAGGPSDGGATDPISGISF